MTADTITAIKKAEHERIWLEPDPGDDPEGRMWCQHNMWGDEAVEYVLASILESLQRENEALKKDRYDLAYAITGGEDAPGLLDSVPTSQLVEIARDNHRSHSADIDRAEAAEAEVKRLRDLVARNWSGSFWRSVNSDMADEVRTALASTGVEHHADK